MFKKSEIFSSFSVKNIAETKHFYTELLELSVIENTMGVLEVEIEHGNNVLIYPKENHQPATFTVLNFPVVDIDNAVDSLINKGILFEQYNGELQTDKKGICRANENGPNIAWFKDPSGNVLSLIQE